ncbi:hypothetical protein JTE90_005170 [Oedothorax gibbosus]|uniref:Uncharacterized protein n=1 Tax=Oedothorax gibbosus TaxID=931172 RepID=A0AAV6TQX2_9ARAC|nr:hypothetical protein JTE90_005170 [Oedothorax gibbosus]
MPRHLISDAHEWINEIPNCPYLLWMRAQLAPILRCVFVAPESFLRKCELVHFCADDLQLTTFTHVSHRPHPDLVHTEPAQHLHLLFHACAQGSESCLNHEHHPGTCALLPYFR